MTFSQSVQTCFNKYATFSGRATRSEYWWWQLFVFIVVFIIVFVVTLVGGEDAGEAIGNIVSLALWLPSLAAAVRRCHDTNHSGWWVICPIYNFVLMLIPSDPSANEYGEAVE